MTLPASPRVRECLTQLELCSYGFEDSHPKPLGLLGGGVGEGAALVKFVSKLREEKISNDEFVDLVSDLLEIPDRNLTTLKSRLAFLFADDFISKDDREFISKQFAVYSSAAQTTTHNPAPSLPSQAVTHDDARDVRDAADALRSLASPGTEASVGGQRRTKTKWTKDEDAAVGLHDMNSLGAYMAVRNMKRFDAGSNDSSSLFKCPNEKCPFRRRAVFDRNQPNHARDIEIQRPESDEKHLDSCTQGCAWTANSSSQENTSGKLSAHQTTLILFSLESGSTPMKISKNIDTEREQGNTLLWPHPVTPR